MKFRKDINGLRAIAVIAVVLFHFNPTWLSGGFAGVDVFFVISGFLMTGIIFRGLEEGNFNTLDFYISRVNRIVPALLILCLTLLLFGYFFLAPLDFKALSKQVFSSIAFMSNIIYWKESGYFEASSHSKWLLHTWSLSTEWQFYMAYPLVLVVMRKVFPIATMKKIVLLTTILALIFSILATYKWPSPAYYLLPTRAWEMLLGGIAYLFPFKLTQDKQKLLEWTGISLIVSSYIFITKENYWPGFLAIFPVFGSFFVLQSQRSNSIITCNKIFQKLGTWSYSIYLWHWPIVVCIYFYSLNDAYIYLGIILSVLLGFLSNKYIENLKFPRKFTNYFDYIKSTPITYAFILISVAAIIFINNGFFKNSSMIYQKLVNTAQPSPYRGSCHINTYQSPKLSCEYFGKNITWATIGDSHSVEIAYALAKKLKPQNIGIKQFSFSACKLAYQESDEFNKCATWYNESVEYILNDTNIRNIVLNHRFTSGFFGGDAINYPAKPNSQKINIETNRMTKNLDELIRKLADSKDNVYVFYPIPELQRDIKLLIGVNYEKNQDLTDIVGTSLDWYKSRNKYIINHFDNVKFPANVHLLNPTEVFCDSKNCFAVKDKIPLYFDDDHPSVIGAEQLINLIFE